MEIKGKIISILPTVTGTGKKGQWMKQEAILETGGQYPRKVCFSLWGEEKINKYDLETGLEVTVHVDPESRESGGRWFTELRAFKIHWDANQKRKWTPSGGETQSTDWP